MFSRISPCRSMDIERIHEMTLVAHRAGVSPLNVHDSDMCGGREWTGMPLDIEFLTSMVENGSLWVVLAFLIILLAAGLLTRKNGAFSHYRRSEYRIETRKGRKKVQKDKGAAGEYETSITLEKIKGKKRLVFNAYIPKANGKGNVETDIIMIHEKGIFVIENKNYAGTIVGRADREYWEQFLGGKRYSFYSPIYQNLHHIWHLRKFLENHLRLSEKLPHAVSIERRGWLQVYSVIVFNDRAEKLKIRKQRKTAAIVCLERKAAGKIKRRLRRMEAVFTEEEVEELYRLLKSRTEVYRWVKRSHRKSVEKYKKERKK